LLSSRITLHQFQENFNPIRHILSRRASRGQKCAYGIEALTGAKKLLLSSFAANDLTRHISKGRILALKRFFWISLTSRNYQDIISFRGKCINHHQLNLVMQTFCANVSDGKRVLRTRTVFAKPTDGSTRASSEVGNERAKKHMTHFGFRC
jgi:hypothetical protein